MIAIEMLGAGHRVTVFERSRGELVGSLGAGLATPTPMFRTLVDRGLVAEDVPHVVVDEMLFVSRTANGDRHGHAALAIPLIFASFHWGNLFRALRSRVPDAHYREGHGAARIESVDVGAVIQLDDGAEHAFDVVVCADGYHSKGRRSLFPDSVPEYRGYVCWRGVLDERDMDRGELMESTFVRFGSSGLSGSFIYPVPGADGSTTRGERLINWGCYVPMPEGELAALLVDANGHRHEGALPPGHLPADRERHLRGIARDSLPPYHAEIVELSEDTFVQAIYSVDVPAYPRGRICFGFRA